MSTYVFMFCILNNLNMPINVFGNSSNNSDNKIDTSLFVQKPYLRSNYIESNIEEDIDLKSQLELKIYLILLASQNQFQKIMLIIILTILVC